MAWEIAWRALNLWYEQGSWQGWAPGCPGWAVGETPQKWLGRKSHKKLNFTCPPHQSPVLSESLSKVCPTAVRALPCGVQEELGMGVSDSRGVRIALSIPARRVARTAVWDYGSATSRRPQGIY